MFASSNNNSNSYDDSHQRNSTYYNSFNKSADEFNDLSSYLLKQKNTHMNLVDATIEKYNSDIESLSTDFQSNHSRITSLNEIIDNLLQRKIDILKDYYKKVEDMDEMKQKAEELRNTRYKRYLEKNMRSIPNSNDNRNQSQRKTTMIAPPSPSPQRNNTSGNKRQRQTVEEEYEDQL